MKTVVLHLQHFRIKRLTSTLKGALPIHDITTRFGYSALLIAVGDEEHGGAKLPRFRDSNHLGFTITNRRHEDGILLDSISLSIICCNWEALYVTICHLYQT